MTHLNQQFALVKEAYPDAAMQLVPAGTSIITIPEVILGDGWSLPRTFIKFVAPVGYPLANPDCFWAHPTLRLKNGVMPQNTNLSPIPGTGEPLLWFSWHTKQWNPNKDNLLTYIRVIKDRLKRAQ